MLIFKNCEFAKYFCSLTCHEDNGCQDDPEVEVVIRRLLEGAGLDSVGEEAEAGAEPEEQREASEQILAELDPLRGLGGRGQSVGAIPLLTGQSEQMRNINEACQLFRTQSHGGFDDDWNLSRSLIMSMRGYILQLACGEIICLMFTL